MVAAETLTAQKRIAMLGPPGAGKGTQAELLAGRLSIPRISTGDILRDAIAMGSQLGRQAGPIMEEGGLVPDDLLMGVIEERLQREDCARGYVLDGFPRTVPQAEGFESLNPGVTADMIVFKLEVPKTELLRRLSGRRWCPKCQATYHVESDPPREDGVCDRDGERLILREDDKESAVARRLTAYERQTKPLIEYYDDRSCLRRVDGDREPQVVHVELSTYIGVPR